MNILTMTIGLLAYLIGAIPVGYLVAQLKGIADIRTHGSGNIGATNVSRLFGIHYFFLIFLLDAGKAFFFIHAIKSFFNFSQLCIFAGITLCGNGYSLFLRGSGGKGVATLFGLLASLCPMTIITLPVVWACIVLATHTVGIASVSTALCLPLYAAFVARNSTFFLFSLFAALWVTHSHHSNIQSYLKKE